MRLSYFLHYLYDLAIAIYDGIIHSYRLYSTAPAFVRVLAEDSNLLGYLIPKNVNFYNQ